jgi:hypothetical protein
MYVKETLNPENIQAFVYINFPCFCKLSNIKFSVLPGLPMRSGIGVVFQHRPLKNFSVEDYPWCINASERVTVQTS